MKHVFTILSFMLLITITSQAQTYRGNPSAESKDRIVKLYPNPATSYITFDVKKDYTGNYMIQIYSFLGKKMYEVANIPQKSTVQLSDFNRGLYIYHLIDMPTGKIIESGKFQVSH
ncbi:MAG: T9SS type A sorting domain-containing protein [Chitinophagaceae bacterium]